MTSRIRIFLPLALLFLLPALHAVSQGPLDLRNTVLVAPTDGPLSKAADFLSDEVYARTGIRWYIRDHYPGAARVVIATADALPEGVSLPNGLAVPAGEEGFALGVSGDTVVIAGRDARGALFGVGRLLRAMTLRPGAITLPRDTRIATAPKYPMRVHQLGYRNTATSYDLWDVNAYEQYLREMAIFGTNGAELIQDMPPGEKDSVLMAESQWSMNMKLAAMMDEYDLEVFVWYPVPILTDDQAQYDREIGYREQFFQEIPRLDHVFVPGGDPGNNHPKVLMPALEKMAASLHRYHPEAGIFVSNQKMTPEWYNWMFDYIREEQPKWLGGYVYGPGTAHTLKQAREWLPDQYEIRHYPDITHNVRAQYQVHWLDGRIAQTLGREGINPRPGHQHAIHTAFAHYTAGFGSYSDGIHDDLNKMVWSALAWDPDADIHEIVVDYGRVFFGEDLGEAVAEGLWMLQANIEANLERNENIPKALAHWRAIGEQASPAVRASWRYQMYLMRAIFDQFTRERAIAEAAYEREAFAALAKAGDTGAADAIAAAKAAFAQADTDAIAPGLVEEMRALADQMFHSIGFQFSVKPPYFTRNPERGALLDALEIPMNDRPWLEKQFGAILAMNNEDERLEAIAALVNWEDPGPGGFYDDLGNPEKQPRLVIPASFEENPSRVEQVTSSHYRWQDNTTLEVNPDFKYSMLSQAKTLAGFPLTLRYDGLDPNAEYKVKVIEFGRYRAATALVADGTHEIHGPVLSETPLWPVEYGIPKAATADGKLELTWEIPEGRGTQVAEVWLIKK
ncbi:MAG: hypothetical protein KF886_03045 [Candidatus Hydrogenedentes bacterium]|nr:hypothetical protein [Candidatus Hydrogenedentota bacterium]